MRGMWMYDVVWCRARPARPALIGYRLLGIRSQSRENGRKFHDIEKKFKKLEKIKMCKIFNRPFRFWTLQADLDKLKTHAHIRGSLVTQLSRTTLPYSATHLLAHLTV